MANMSYCRFENTYHDLRDCHENLAGKLSDSETRYRHKLIKLCETILQDVNYNFTDEELPEDLDQMLLDAGSLEDRSGQRGDEE